MDSNGLLDTTLLSTVYLLLLFDYLMEYLRFLGYPLPTRVYPVSSLLKGNTPIVVSGENIQWTQSVVSKNIITFSAYDISFI